MKLQRIYLYIISVGFSHNSAGRVSVYSTMQILLPFSGKQTLYVVFQASFESQITVQSCLFIFFFRHSLLINGISYKIHIHTTQNSQNKWTKISDLETTIFESNMMVKSGLVFFILKFYQPLQSYLLTCQANSAFPGSFFCTGQQ